MYHLIEFTSTVSERDLKVAQATPGAALYSEGGGPAFGSAPVSLKWAAS